MANDLEGLLGRAKILLAKFEDILRMRREVEKMSQSVIAEIRSFSSPPKPVEEIMQATFLILGENAKEIEVIHFIKYILSSISHKNFSRTNFIKISCFRNGPKYESY